MQSPYKLVIASVAFAFSTHSGHGAATRIAFQDGFATARGNAFTATADNPSAVFYNAAGLTQLDGTELRSNAYIFSANYKYSGALGSAQTDDTYQPIPSFFAAHKFADTPYAVGFGMYAPFGLGMDWGIGAPFAPVAYEADLAYVKYHVVFAWQITDTLSIGLGPSYDTGDIEIKSTTPGGSFSGDGATQGYSLSILYQPSESHSFGLNYQAATKMKFKGTASLFGKSDAYLKFPESIVLGYAWTPNEKWNLEFNLDWTNWDRVNNLTLRTGLGNVPVVLNWESAFIWELGITRYFEAGWHASAGYTFVENAVPDTEFSPIVPDADRHYFQFGVGRDYERFSWQFTYQFTYAPDRTVSGNTNVLPNGNYDLESQGFGLSLGYRF